MASSSTYQPLADYLAHKKADSWEATFSDVEATLGRPLPKSAYRHQAWWANQNGPGHSQTHGWRSVGWRTTKLDLEQCRVRFEREQKASPVVAGGQPGIDADSIDETLVQRAIAISDIGGRGAVINAALREFIKREAIRGVIEMGGCAPDFEAAPRERPWS